MKKILIKSLYVLIALILSVSALAACDRDPAESSPSVFSADEDSNKWEPFGKYEEQVVVNIGRNYEPAHNLPSPHTMEDNLLLDHIEDRLNIKINYAWLADANTYNDRVNMIITSGNLPDVMLVKSLTQFNQLVEAELLEDIAIPFEKTISPYLKSIFDSYGDRAFNTSKFGDALYAVPDLNPGYHFAIMWIRDDWLRRANAEAPSTLDEVEALARKFVDMKLGGANTVGLATNGWLYGFNNSFPTMDPVFHYYNGTQDPS